MESGDRALDGKLLVIRRFPRLLPQLVQLVAHLDRHMHVWTACPCSPAIEVAFGRTFLSLCRSASVSDCFRSMRCCHLRFSWLSSRCLPIATQHCWKGLPPLPVGTHCALGAGVALAARAEGEIRATLHSGVPKESADLTYTID